MNGDVIRALVACVVVGAGAPFASAMFSPATADVGDLTPAASDAAGGFTGNDVGGSGTALFNLITADVFDTGGEDWVYVGQSDEPNTPFSSAPGEADDAKNGTLVFSEPQDGPFAITIKAGNFYSLYYYDTSFTGVAEIGFTTSGVAQNPGGNSPGFSHGTLYRLVPAPGALAGFGVVGVMGARRRR